MDGFAEETTEVRDVVTIDPNEVKIGCISRKRMREESLVMMLPRTLLMDGFAEEATEMCDDIASEPAMEKADAEIPREATQNVVEDAVKITIEVGADSAKKPTLVGVEDVEGVLVTAELGVDAASKPVMVMASVNKFTHLMGVVVKMSKVEVTVAMTYMLKQLMMEV